MPTPYTRPDPWFWNERRLWVRRPSEGRDAEEIRDFARRSVDANYNGRPSPNSRRRPRPEGQNQ